MTIQQDISVRPHVPRRRRISGLSWNAMAQSAGGRTVPLVVTDISPMGLGVTCVEPLPVDLLNITVQVPKSPDGEKCVKVDLQAQIIHQSHSDRSNRAGLGFVQIGLVDLYLLINR